MSRKHIPLDQRKVSLTLSLPYPLWVLGKDKGSRHMVDLIMQGMWAKQRNINELTLNKLKHDFEEKIMKMQMIIDCMVKETDGDLHDSRERQED